jgi:iron complex transport system ATP-binding protein
MIELENLSVAYGKHLVLTDASLKLERGKMTSIIGCNGCGKSTLLKAVTGILSPVNGLIKIDGVPVEALGKNERAKRIAYLSQARSAPDMTVGELVLHGRYPHLSYPRRYSKKDKEIANAAMAEMGILELSDTPLATLSGGMRQKAYIAMALAQDTDYILLDEPATYLDISNQLELMRILRRLADAGKGIVTVTHDLPMAFGFSDAIAVLDGGRIALCDTPKKVCGSQALRESLGVSLSRSSTSGQYGYEF